MSCQVVFDTPPPFYTGAVVAGKVLCHLSSNTKFRGIKLRVLGDEHTEWTGTESHYNASQKRTEIRTIILTGDNSLFSMEIMLYGGSSGEVTLQSGTHSFPFQIQLPGNLPSSFENSYGHIRYKFKGIVDIPFAFDYEGKQYPPVLAPIDLKTISPEFHNPTEFGDEKTVCCWCCASGPITMDVTIQKRAFVPGELVNLQVSLTNMSNVNVESVEAKLCQNIKCHVNSPRYEDRTDSDVLVSAAFSGVGAHGDNTYDIALQIPSQIAIPNFHGSHLFEIYHYVEVSAVLPGCHTNLDVEMGVEMGHIPLPTQYPPPVNMGQPEPVNPGYAPAYSTSGYPYPEGQQPPAYPYPAEGSSNGKEVYPGGAPSAPGQMTSPSKPGYNMSFSGTSGAPSAPPSAPFPSEPPPPSYDDIHKKPTDSEGKTQ